MSIVSALGLALLSGFAGLSYEIIWTQQLSLGLGHELVAVLAVLAAFFGGLALGALSLGRAIERSTRPARGYAACEALLAGWALVLSESLVHRDAATSAPAAPAPRHARAWPQGTRRSAHSRLRAERHSCSERTAAPVTQSNHARGMHAIHVVRYTWLALELRRP